MTTASELRGLALEAFERSERAALMTDVQWFLKVRRVLSDAADELERRHGNGVDLDGGPAAAANVVRIRGQR